MNVSSSSRIGGKLVLLAVLALGSTGAGGAWWYRQRLQRGPLQLWGSEAAGLIIHAPHVELCRLEPAVDEMNSEALRVAGKTYGTVDCLDAARVRGLLHLRHSLLIDHSFDWSDSGNVASDWRYALRFRDGGRLATLVVSDDFRYLLLAETGARGCVGPIAHGVKLVIGDAWANGLSE